MGEMLHAQDRKPLSVPSLTKEPRIGAALLVRTRRLARMPDTWPRGFQIMISTTCRIPKISMRYWVGSKIAAEHVFQENRVRALISVSVPIMNHGWLTATPTLAAIAAEHTMARIVADIQEGERFRRDEALDAPQQEEPAKSPRTSRPSRTRSAWCLGGVDSQSERQAILVLAHRCPRARPTGRWRRRIVTYGGDQAERDDDVIEKTRAW